MLSFYRGHTIIVLIDDVMSAEISERCSGLVLPTKVSVLLEEGELVLLQRAQDLIDMYIDNKTGSCATA